MAVPKNQEPGDFQLAPNRQEGKTKASPTLSLQQLRPEKRESVMPDQLEETLNNLHEESPADALIDLRAN